MADKTDFATRYGPWAIVAGASEGLGAAYAEQLAGRGLNLVLIARRDEMLNSLAAKLSTEYGIQTKTIALDLSLADAAGQIAQATSGLEVGLLVYNAAFPLWDPFWNDRLTTIRKRSIPTLLLLWS